MPFPDRLRARVRDRLGTLAVCSAIGAVAVGALLSLQGANPSTVRLAAEPSPISTDSAPLYVHVAGAVRHPGLVRLAFGSRVVDAIAAAGGFAPDADPAAVNLARELRSGEQIRVATVGQSPAEDTGALGAESALVNLNTAARSALETLPHVGPALAGRIIAYRTEHGGFGSVDELGRVPGIGPKRLDELRLLVCV